MGQSITWMLNLNASEILSELQTLHIQMRALSQGEVLTSQGFKKYRGASKANHISLSKV